MGTTTNSGAAPPSGLSDGAAPAAVLTTPLLSPSSHAAPWAIDPTVLPLHYASLDPSVALAAADEVEAAPEGPRRHGNRSGTVAVIRADGIILPRCAAFFERIGYATSCESLASRVESAIGEGASAVAVLFNSPGGSVFGVAEAAARIAAAAKTTPIVAVADHFAASGAYWLAASCTAIAASRSAMVGSVGVISIRIGVSRMADMDGIDIDIFSRGDGKLDSHPAAELDDAGRKRLQATVDAYYADFVAAAAAGRGQTPRTVERTWGAQVLTSSAAKNAGMIDTILTADEVIARLATAAGRRAFRNMGAAAAIVSAVARNESQKRPGGTNA